MAKDVLEFAFTRYVGSLDERGEPDPDAFVDAWNKLRRILSSELGARGLRDAPPTFLGVYGYESWWEPPPGAIKELIQDCFTSVFVERIHLLRGLYKKLKHIEGIPFRYIRNFMHDRQRKSDPVGYRVYKVVHAAVDGEVKLGHLEVVSHSGVGAPLEDASPIGNDTVLGPAEASAGSGAGRWSDALLVEMMRAKPQQLKKIEELLGEHLSREAVSSGGFRFGDVLHQLKTEVRARWGMAWKERSAGSSEEEDDEAWREIRLCAMAQGIEGSIDFENLWLCVNEGLPHQGKTAKTREHLRKLWLFVRDWVARAGEEELPSARELEKLLGIPRKSIPAMLAILKQLLHICRGD